MTLIITYISKDVEAIKVEFAEVLKGKLDGKINYVEDKVWYERHLDVINHIQIDGVTVFEFSKW